MRIALLPDRRWFCGLLAALCAAQPAWAAQEEDKIPPPVWPVLPERARDAQGFVPVGWKLEVKAEGDLNGDGRPDLALVLHQQDASRITHPDMCENPFDSNPRLLLVAFGEVDGYRLIVTNHKLIPVWDNPCMDDPFSDESELPGGMDLQNGALSITLGLWMSAGGWEMGQSRFTFRWRGGKMALVGYDADSTNRSSGATDDISVNYLTGQVARTTGQISDDQGKTRWSRLPVRPLLSLADIGDGLDFDPETGKSSD